MIIVVFFGPTLLILLVDFRDTPYFSYKIHEELIFPDLKSFFFKKMRQKMAMGFGIALISLYISRPNPAIINVMSTIKNIVFDLGNVLLDLHLNKTEEAFRELLQEEFEEAYIKYEADQLFERLEVGLISPNEFVMGMRAATSVPITDDEVKEGWNALLGDLPMDRIELLKTLAQDYRIFLLSNTNAIHMMWLNEYLEDNYDMTIQDFTDLFEGHYFSFQHQVRKPQAAFFELILKEAELEASETLFVDDRPDNVAAAKALGFQTLQHNPEEEVARVLPAFLHQ